jgi:monomeric phenylalanine-4-hydroxylase
MSNDILSNDHPGFHDPVYRARREEIAALARRARETGEIPVIPYTEDEHAVWRAATSRLAPLHDKSACSKYLSAKRRLGIGTDRIPQLKDLDRRLRAFDFGLAAVDGLISARTFLSTLAEGRMLCTQYIRHASRPEYTPEPDVIHEVVGHVPTFTDPDMVALNKIIGRAAAVASRDMMRAIERLYWFTVEFGLIEEHGEIKAFGAGLLSSVGEIQFCFTPDVERRPFSVAGIIETPYDYSRMQEKLFVIPSFAALRREVEAFLAPTIEKSPIPSDGLARS